MQSAPSLFRPFVFYSGKYLAARVSGDEVVAGDVLLWDVGNRQSEAGSERMPTVTDGLPPKAQSGGPFVAELPSIEGMDELRLGRSEESNLVLPDPSVSRMHAVLHLDAAKTWMLTEAGSRNGTFVDDCRLADDTRVALRSGAAVRLGEVVLRFLSRSSFLKTIQNDLC
jgi:hypothetical protein